MFKNILWIAAFILFAQKSFALSQESYECIRYDGAIKILFNVYADDEHNHYLGAEAYRGQKTIFYGTNIQVKNGVLKALNVDKTKKYVFDFSSLNLKESHAENTGPMKIYGKITHYECTGLKSNVRTR